MSPSNMQVHCVVIFGDILNFAPLTLSNSPPNSRPQYMNGFTALEAKTKAGATCHVEHLEARSRACQGRAPAPEAGPQRSGVAEAG